MFFAFVAILLLMPLMMAASLCLAFNNGNGKIFFTQLRPGKNGRIFRIIKFKTMTDACDSSGCPLPDEKRLTAVGRWLRASSIDELPQLINVIKGDMSLIGPRPLLPEYLPLYSKQQARRHELRPGITGWAQTHGRNDISWNDRFAHDIWYIDHCTLITDLKIIWLTIFQVLSHKGISHEGNCTMPPFTGSI